MAATITVAEGQAPFDLAALAAYPAQHVEGFEGAFTLSRFSGGQSNPTFKLAGARKSFVMRTKPAAAHLLLKSAHAIDREFRVQSGLAQSDVPVARMYCLCEDEAIIGRAFYIMEMLEGRVLWDQLLPGMQPAERAAMYDEMNRVIAALHRVDPAAVGLADYGKPGNYFARQISRWSRQYQDSRTDDLKAMDRLIEWLPAHIPEEPVEHVSIVHGDYRLDNLVFHPTEPRVIGILDWELSTLGHPLADFSYQCMAWHVSPDVFRGIGGHDLAALGIPSAEAYVARYLERTGFTIQGDWNFYLSYNLFRIAAIMQGIKKRALDGIASNSEALKAAEATGPLAELAWQFAVKAGAR